ncbi:MAG TPA: dethiobiotin synthase [Solirubrobacteraceae bacterium]|nr:dethiobiotin synthase [Solirubrobacteraceae bacterium]
MLHRGCFVTGTDTAAGKTVVATAIAAALRARGEPVAAWKPVVTGVAEPQEGAWPADHELLARAAGAEPADVTTATFGPAVSPHLAAQLAGSRLSLEVLVRAAHRAAAAAGDAAAFIAEGVGGLLVPFGDFTVRDLAVALGLPLVVAARPGLGTINHSLLTLEAARAAGLDVRAVVLTPWPDEPGVMQRSNRATIERLGDVEVAALPATSPTFADLARAGEALPFERWIGP